MNRILPRTRHTARVLLLFCFLCAANTQISAGEQTSDAQVVAYTKAALANDPRVEDSDVEVESSQGVVTLTGIVNSLAARTHARSSAGAENCRGRLRRGPHVH